MTIIRSSPGLADSAPLRAEALALIASGDTQRAVRRASEIQRLFPSTRTARMLHAAIRAHRSRHPSLRKVRVAILSNYTSEFVHDHLAAWGLASALDVEIYQAPHDTFRQEILNSASGLYQFNPDAIVLALEGRYLLPWAYRDFLCEPAADSASAAWREEIRSLAHALRRATTATLLVHNFVPPAYPALGMTDSRQENGQNNLIRRVNDDLAAVARTVSDMYIVDCSALAARHGILNWHDARMDHFARMPVAASMQSGLAAEYVKFLRAMYGMAKKCLVVDLDNTIWGGVVGEDGALGVALGPTYPGSAFVEFQRYLLQLRARGVILAIASKNNRTDVDELFATNPAMILEPSHFAAAEVHWRPKSDSIANIAASLGIGLEHMVFVDDSPAECAEVAAKLPALTTITLPSQPEKYVEALQVDGWFDALSNSDEDRRRGELYEQRAKAEALRVTAVSIEDYYRDLMMEVSLRPIDEKTVTRASQLTQKTNQFNTTTRRLNEAELLRRQADPDWLVATCAVRDRFGDNGIVGLVMAKHGGGVVDIDTLLLSCRVIGRTIETALLAHVCEWARKVRARAITGLVVPTPKNEPVRDVYERHKFTAVGEGGEGATLWQLETAAGVVGWPAWLQRTSGTEPSLRSAERTHVDG